MFVIENTIKVKKGYLNKLQERFHHLGKIEKVPGFIDLNLLQKRGNDEFDVLVVWSKWESQKAHNEWAASDMFRKAHDGARSEYVLDASITFYDVIAQKSGEVAATNQDVI